MSTDTLCRDRDPDALAQTPEKAYLLVGESEKVRAKAEEELRRGATTYVNVLDRNREAFSVLLGERSSGNDERMDRMKGSIETAVQLWGNEAVQTYKEKRVKGLANDRPYWNTHGFRMYVQPDTDLYPNYTSGPIMPVREWYPDARTEGDLVCIEFANSSFSGGVVSLRKGNETKSEIERYRQFCGSGPFSSVGGASMPEHLAPNGPNGPVRQFVPICKIVRVEGYEPTEGDGQRYGFLWQNSGYTWEGSLRGEPTAVATHGFERRAS